MRKRYSISPIISQHCTAHSLHVIAASTSAVSHNSVHRTCIRLCAIDETAAAATIMHDCAAVMRNHCAGIVRYYRSAIYTPAVRPERLQADRSRA